MEKHQVLHLSQQQLTQLTTYCSVYRSYLWQQILPTAERNQLIRDIQLFQARIEKASEQGETDVDFPFSEDEKNTLKQIFTGVTQVYGTAPASEQRIQQLSELTTFRLLVERMFRQNSTS